MSLEEETINLTKWFLGVPKSKITIFLMIFWALTVGIITAIISPEGFSQSIGRAIVSSIFTIGLPSFLTALTVFILFRRITLRRLLFISFIGSLIYGINYIIFSITGSTTFVIIGFSFAFIFWFSTLYIIFGLRKTALLFSIIQLTFSLIFFVADQQTLSKNLWTLLIKMYLSVLIMLSSLYIIIYIINAPMKKTVGVPSTEAAHLFFEQWLFGSKNIEDMMKKISQPIITYVDWIKIDELKLVLPYVHFGPFGNIGGSRFSELIPQYLGKSVVFHAPVTREFNPDSEESVIKLVQPIKNIENKEKKDKKLRGTFFRIKHKTAHADVIVLNDFVIVGLSRAPESTEDIDPGLGEAIKRIIESSGYKTFLIDMHNSETNDITSILPGSETAAEYIELAEIITEKLKEIKDKEKKPVRIGYYEIKKEVLPSSVKTKLGNAGIKILTFLFGNNERYTMIIIDANGIRPDARELLTDDNSEVYTTDTHVINTVRGVINPITYKEAVEILEFVKKGIKKSIELAKEQKQSKGSFHREKIKINVLGRNTTTEIIATLNSIVTIAKLIVPIMIILSIVIIMTVLEYFKNIGI